MRNLIDRVGKAWTSLLKTPGYLLTVLISLGASLGALVSIFGINSILLLEPLPYPAQDRLAVVQTELHRPGQTAIIDSNLVPIVDHLVKNQDHFEAMAVASYTSVKATYRGDTHRLSAAYVSSEYFPLLGATFAKGSYFASEKDSNLPQGVLSYRLWNDSFNADPELVGRAISVNNVAFKVVGILARSFEEPQLNGINWSTDLWLSWDHSKVKEAINNWGLFYDSVKVLSLLKSPDNFTRQEIARKLTARYAPMFVNNTVGISVFDDANLKLQIIPLDKYLIGDSYVSSLLMLGGMVALLIIVIANITNLVLARSAQKNRDYAVFASLGAKPMHIYKHILTECLVLMFVSGALALAISLAAMPYLVEMTKSSFPRAAHLSVGFVHVLFLNLMCLGLALFFAYLTYKQTDYRHLALSLNSSGKGNVKQVSKKTRQILVTSQVIISTLLLTAILTLTTQSLRIWVEPVHVDTQDTYLTRMQSKGKESLSDDAVTQMMLNLRDGLRQMHVFEEVSLSSRWPYSSQWGLMLTKGPGAKEVFNINMTPIDESWLPMFDVDLLSGRNFTDYDVKSQANIIMINESAARLMSSQPDKILGERFYWDSPEAFVEVVGVIKDVKMPGTEQKPMVYTPQNAEQFLVLKSKKGRLMNGQSFAEYVSQVNPSVDVAMFMDLHALYTKRRAPEKIMIAMSLVLSAVTLALVALGLYGILNYQVSMRRFEFGIRMSLGAKGSHIIKQCFVETIVPSMIGIMLSVLIGALIYINFTDGIESVIQNASSAWILPMIMSIGMIASIIMINCIVPLRPIVTKPPVNSLRL